MQAERAPVVAVAIVVAVAVSSLAAHRVRRPEVVAVLKHDANAAASQAVKDARAAKDQLDKLLRELDELDNQIARAAEALYAADNDADRAAATARLERLLQEQHDIMMRTAASRAVAFRPERIKYQYRYVPRRCMDNPLAQGCY